MTTYVALLRGINVGGRNRLAAVAAANPYLAAAAADPTSVHAAFLSAEPDNWRTVTALLEMAGG